MKASLLPDDAMHLWGTQLSSSISRGPQLISSPYRQPQLCDIQLTEWQHKPHSPIESNMDGLSLKRSPYTKPDSDAMSHIYFSASTFNTHSAMSIHRIALKLCKVLEHI